jgi:hypothetical protein
VHTGWVPHAPAPPTTRRFRSETDPAGDEVRKALVMTKIRRAGTLRWALKAMLWVLVVSVVVPVGAFAAYLSHTDRWQGDVPAVVTGVPDSFYYHVDFTAKLPPDAMASWPDGGSVVEPAGELRPGDAVVCRVVQTYSVNKNFDSGPQTKITTCRR